MVIKKLTSQKWCLEIDTTVSKDFKAKKHFLCWGYPKICFFEVKHCWKLQKVRFWVILSTENRFLALKFLETVVLISKYHFWEVHFWWPKWYFRCKKGQKRYFMKHAFFVIFLHLKCHSDHQILKIDLLKKHTGFVWANRLLSTM